MWAAPAPKRVQIFLMSSSRSGPWAGKPAVIGTCLGGQCSRAPGWKQNFGGRKTISPSCSNQQSTRADWQRLWKSLLQKNPRKRRWSVHFSWFFTQEVCILPQPYHICCCLRIKQHWHPRGALLFSVLGVSGHHLEGYFNFWNGSEAPKWGEVCRRSPE